MPALFSVWRSALREQALGQKMLKVDRRLDGQQLRLGFPHWHIPLNLSPLQTGDQAPLKACYEVLFQGLDFAGRDVARKHDLFVVLVKQAEGVKQFFLKTFLADQKLNLVNEKHIRLKVLLAESGKLPILDCVHKFTRELFCGQVGHLCIWVALVYVVADGVEQMGFAQADAAMNEQRIMGFAGIFGGG